MDKRILDLEAKGCFDFFWNEANTDKNSPGYGLIRDNTAESNKNMASIASVGFGLSAIIIGIEKKWITYEEGYERTLGTLNTFLNNVEESEGFFFHFLHMETAKKFEAFYDCASIIDTSLFLNGAVTSAEYFCGDIKEVFEKIFNRVNWQKYYDEKNNMYFMGYNPETGGFGHWDMYAEQLMQYIFGVASPTHPVPKQIYNGFRRDLVKYSKYEFYHSPGGALFTHQFSHAWFNFENIIDEDGINWYENSVKASLAAKKYCNDNAQGFKTFAESEHAWGLTACDGPHGYKAYGAGPFHPNCDQYINDGTIAPAAAAGSIVFTPKESIEALNYFYENVPELWSKYGFLDSYNRDVTSNWVSDRVIGIDKGATLLMIENYQTGLIWDLYMKNDYVKNGAKLLGWKRNNLITS
ncbi:glucoamylase family protein [Gottfriedia acidiceleris]|uniref:glucoamylase family protein n=1 Tax=Gottfriedia acidiceleris TaxID=371036 RepID=UPI002FFE0AA6